MGDQQLKVNLERMFALNKDINKKQRREKEIQKKLNAEMVRLNLQEVDLGEFKVIRTKVAGMKEKSVMTSQGVDYRGVEIAPVDKKIGRKVFITI